MIFKQKLSLLFSPGYDIDCIHRPAKQKLIIFWLRQYMQIIKFILKRIFKMDNYWEHPYFFKPESKLLWYWHKYPLDLFEYRTMVVEEMRKQRTGEEISFIVGL